MVLDPRSRQKKIERRKAKEKSKERAQKHRDQRLEELATQAMGTAPILHCCVNQSIWDQGIGHLLLSRLLPTRQVAVATYLLDLKCLGVKDAGFAVVDRGHYDRNVYEGFAKAFAIEALEPACARKLIEGAVEYAGNLGLPPHPDFSKAKLILGDIRAETCQRTFEYGKDGKPLFIGGPHDSLARCKRIVRVLTERCGPDGFHYIVPIDDPDSSEPNYRFAEDGPES